MPPRRKDAAATPAPSASSSAPPVTLAKARAAATSTSSTLHDLLHNYNLNTPKNLKLLDGFQLFLMLTGIAQFLYCLLVTNYPFNAFLGGFAATVGQFVLSASLRAQVNPANKTVFPSISPERAFADFLFGSLILHFFVFNYLG